MRLREVAHLLQIGHHVADGGWTEVAQVVSGDTPRPYRLSGGDIVMNDHLQDLTLSRSQFMCPHHPLIPFSPVLFTLGTLSMRVPGYEKILRKMGRDRCRGNERGRVRLHYQARRF